MSACAIVIELREDGRYSATCSLLPDFEIVAVSEEAARGGIERALEEYVLDRFSANENETERTE